MANIDSKIDVIRTAERGENVRDAIIGALRDINNDVPADMSNPVQKEYNMPQGSDLTVPLNPPELVSQIIVRQPGSGGKSTTLNDITVTENGVYPTDEEGYDPDKENRYYSKVTVKVPQLANAVLDLEEEITQNGTYSAPADWGVDGIRTFTVNVNAATGDGPFQVEFYDRPADDPMTKVIYTEINVPLYGSASFKGPSLPTDPTGLGRSFAGWNPSPVNVTRDMKCYPSFVSQQMMPGEGPDWDVICADGGASYPIGTYKSLYYSATFKNAEIEAYGFRTGTTYDKTISFEVMMTKVAEGEDGSKSTWLSSPTTMGFVQDWWPDWNGAKYYNWPDRIERKWMQLLFTKFAPCFLQHVKAVTKYTQGSVNIDPPFSILTTQDNLWMTSLKEICIDNDYWQQDLSAALRYDSSLDHDKAKAKYYDNIPLCIPYMNQAGLTPKQRDDLFYLNSSQYVEFHPGVRDTGDKFTDRRITLGQGGKREYINPETEQTESSFYMTDCGTPFWARFGWIFGFCLV